MPVPTEFEVDAGLMESSLSEALTEAERQNVSGRELTPFLLSHLASHTGGATLRANIALLENNARVAAKIAQEVMIDK